MKIHALPIAVTLAMVSSPILAQSTLPAPTQAPSRQNGLLGGVGGLLGRGALPSVGSAGLGNVAGLLGYCVKNKILGGANATSVLGQLGNRQGVTSTPGYAAGQAGTLQTGGSTLSLDSLKGQVKTKMCDLVLNRAQSFLPRQR